jgi:hypothetical protein
MAAIANFCLYQLGWFACVLGAGMDRPGLGMTCALALVIVHLWLTRATLRQLAVMATAGVIGLTSDTLQMWWGVFYFPHGTIVDWFAPLWVGVLWIQFATLLPFSLRWLSRRYWLSAALALVGGPLAYYAGEKAGAVEFLAPRLLHFAVLGVVWSIAFPALLWISDRLDLVAVVGGRYCLPWGESRTPQTATNSTRRADGAD